VGPGHRHVPKQVGTAWLNPAVVQVGRSV
jgi:hypothetical protein